MQRLKTAIVFYPEETPEGAKPRKYRKVESLDKLMQWLQDHNAGHWKYANIYDSKTKEFIERIYQ